MNGLNIIITEHARDVMKRRDITFDDIAEIIARPQIREVATDREPKPGATYYRYVVDELAVVVAEARRGDMLTRTIITILLRRGEDWTDEDARVR